MSAAWQLFSKCLSIATGNYWSFVKIWFTSILIVLVVMMIFGSSYLDDFILMMSMDVEMMSAEQLNQVYSSLSSMSILVILFSILISIVFSGLAVNSFRYYLGDFKPSWVPFKFDWSATFAFMGWSIVLGLIWGLLIFIPAWISVGLLGAAAQSGSGFMVFISWLFMMIAVAFAYWICFRLGNKLVGRTIGNIHSFGEAWNKTKGSFAFYFGLTVFIVITAWLFWILFSLVFGLFYGIFQNSQTMLSIITFLVLVGFAMLYIFQYALFFSIGSEVYSRFFLDGKDTKAKA